MVMGGVAKGTKKAVGQIMLLRLPFGVPLNADCKAFCVGHVNGFDDTIRRHGFHDKAIGNSCQRLVRVAS